MKKLLYSFLTFILIFNTSLAQEAINYSEKELIIKINSDVEFDSENCLMNQKFNNSSIDALNNAAFVENIKATGNRKIGRTFLLKLKYETNIIQLVDEYMNTGLFEFVEPNYIATSQGMISTPSEILFTPNDPHYYNKQWYHYNDGTFPLTNATDDADIDTDLAWDITQGDPNIIIAALDTGINTDHIEFTGRSWINDDEVLDGTDTDNNGYIDDVEWGWDFINEDNDPSDDQGHGTAVIGAIAATGNNGIGLAGVNWESKIMAIKVLGSNGGTWAQISDGIYYAVDNGANVINMSIGGPTSSGLLLNAVNYAYDHNVLIVAAAGNSNSTSIGFPAKFPNTIAVGATDPDDTRSVPFINCGAGSNYGPELDFVAPGNYFYYIDYLDDTNYELVGCGTSASTPLVTGVVSLLLSINPNLTPDDIRATLEASSEDEVGDSEDTPGWDQYYGFGRINAYEAVTNIIVLGLEENTNLESNIIMHPNPATSIINLEGNLNELQVSIYDMLGREVFSQKATKQLDVNWLEVGTYIFQFSDGTKTSTSKLIKN